MAYRRRSYGGYRRRSYGGGRKKSSGARVRRELRAEIAGTVDTLVTSKLNIPIDSTRNVGINIHGMAVEKSLPEPTGTITDADWASVWLSRSTPAAERHISDIDCIMKVKYFAHKHGTPANAGVDSTDEAIVEAKAYPPVPVFQDEIVLATYHHLGTACTYYVNIAYTLAWMSIGQVVGIAKNIII